MRNLTLTTWICLAGLVGVLAFAVFGEEAVEEFLFSPSVADSDEDVPGADLTRLALPAAPERTLVEKYCQACHHLTRVQKAGGDVDDWTSRIDRMIRNGAQVPRQEVPAIAAYLASALPPRERSPD